MFKNYISQTNNLYHIELPCKERSSAKLGLALIRRVIFKKFTLMFESMRYRFGSLNIPLTTIHDWNIAESERNDAACQNVHDVRSFVPA